MQAREEGKPVLQGAINMPGRHTYSHVASKEYRRISTSKTPSCGNHSHSCFLRFPFSVSGKVLVDAFFLLGGFLCRLGVEGDPFMGIRAVVRTFHFASQWTAVCLRHSLEQKGNSDFTFWDWLKFLFLQSSYALAILLSVDPKHYAP